MATGAEKERPLRPGNVSEKSTATNDSIRGRNSSTLSRHLLCLTNQKEKYTGRRTIKCLASLDLIKNLRNLASKWQMSYYFISDVSLNFNFTYILFLIFHIFYFRDLFSCLRIIHFCIFKLNRHDIIYKIVVFSFILFVSEIYLNFI